MSKDAGTATERATTVHKENVIIRPLPKLAYMWPTWLAVFVCGFVSGVAPSAMAKTGVVFSFIFFFNLAIITFEFNRMRAVALGLLFVVLVLLGTMYSVFGTIFSWLGSIQLAVPSGFYWFWAVGFTVLFGLMFLKTRFDYWEITSNELMHHSGLLGDVQRWPAPNLRLTKEINDVLEYMLLFSGRLVFIPSGEQRAIVLENVMGINTKEAAIKRILSKLQVQHVDE